MDLVQTVRSWLHPARSWLKKLPYRGHGRTCSCCGQEFKRFEPIGDPPRPDAQCPNCGSRERHRLLALVVSRRPSLIRGRVLHFAAEPAMTRLLRPKAGEYVTSDLSAAADIKADITKLPFPDGRWDLIVCSHVLEHVIDDSSAMSELRRVLSKDGHTIVMVPRNVGQVTDEDPSVTDPDERLRRFGQTDHVRVYGDDLESRLYSAGFTTIEPISMDQFTPEEIKRYRLQAINAGAGDAALICS